VDHDVSIVESGAAGAPSTQAIASLTWADEQATQAFALVLAGQIALRDAFITLHGDLGAGKTTLARHLLQALGVEGRIKSPTYTIVETYELPELAISHFDFYRFNDPQEWEDAGFRDIFASPGLKLAEWPQKAAGLLPRPDMDVLIQAEGDSLRRVTLEAFTPRGRALLLALVPTPAVTPEGAA
jgi:tRNA threonylcarbamoyladenosine biosynthesis protein TsaE